jgi:putative holliday junction resolvase
MVDFPQTGRLLGVDVGNARTGLAVCDARQTMASPLDQLQRKSPEHDATAFAKVVLQQQIVGLVVGLPYNMDGSIGPQAKAYETYGNWLGTTLNLPVIFWDERLTTVAAEEMLWDAGLTHKKRKERRDKLAATLILQGYLDQRELLV